MATIFALGSNGSGQLGIGHKEDVSVPKPALFSAGSSRPASVKAIAAGGNHTLLLSASGELYWSGDATTGACGPAAGQQPAFQKMALDPAEEAGVGGGMGDAGGPVCMVAATWEASVFTRLDGHGKNTRVYSCGLGEKGELGHGPLVVRIPRPAQMPGFPPRGTEVVALAACMGHAVAVLDGGEAYGWGSGRKGQLGAPAADVVSSPRRIEGVGFRVARAACGKDFTCLVGEPARGEILVLGSDKWAVRSSAPTAVPGWKDVRASWSNVFVLGSDGKLQSWGRDDYSQNTPADTPEISHVAIGSEHAVALLGNGDVLAWGWGEHGNCGPLTKTGGRGERNIIASSKYIPEGSKIAAVGAGCATSWIIIEETSQGAV